MSEPIYDNDALPALETECWKCEGDGNNFYALESFKGYKVCDECGGSGYLPTQAGRRVLELVRHNPQPSCDAKE